jgi:division protein CdvB (Snf7/Vps24/ESCRT-III family)
VEVVVVDDDGSAVVEILDEVMVDGAVDDEVESLAPEDSGDAQPASARPNSVKATTVRLTTHLHTHHLTTTTPCTRVPVAHIGTYA